MDCEKCKREECFMHGSDECKCHYCSLYGICKKEKYQEDCYWDEMCMFIAE